MTPDRIVSTLTASPHATRVKEHSRRRPHHDKFVETTRELLHDPKVIAARDAAIGPWLADEVDQELRGFDPRHMGMI